ncbi:MAG: dTDP-glucose 4,6-dehydratase [Lentisphaeria bacterium]
MKSQSTIFVTGGAGFIGSNFLHCLVPQHPEYTFVNVDKLTYAGNPLSLQSIKTESNYRFERVDIANFQDLKSLFETYQPEIIINFAAESHVDRSLQDPSAFVQSNIVGTFNLLECCRQYWLEDNRNYRFHHVSTDEVFGELGNTGKFTETTPYAPSNPYSATKASSDHLARAYHRSHGIPVTITNCSNNYGPRQFPEKLIPLMILNARAGKDLPVYGKGENVRDWLFVDDHTRLIWEVICHGTPGETYNVGGECEMRNLEVVQMICDIVDELVQSPPHMQGPEVSRRSLIHFVSDRPGHDFRYAMDTTKIRRELGWQPRETLASGLRKTVQWYLANPEWVRSVQTGEYREWIAQNYGAR